eukprot:TRINITY_DN6251_c0_g1_i2.p1 TRINITY_DN6251_c0_g1~~TRINITY_DN6251_c0_g1_i2.p1  ORF type:complete len:220 (+),score=40.49 TRINITY_DN6251_c0_g1_i2:28-687(+)
MPERLLLTGPRWGVADLVVAGKQILCNLPSNKPDTIHTTNTGFSLWDASYVMIHLLVGFEKDVLPVKRVLELGAGRGTVGIAAALLGAHVTVTDMPEVVPSLQEVVDANKAAHDGISIDVMALDWFRTDDCVSGAFDYILASDVIWVEELVVPLANTLRRFADDRTVVLLATETRSLRIEQLLIDNMRLSFDVVALARAEMHSYYQSERIQVYRMQRRA